MNKKNISDIVSDIDSRFIEEAASVKKKKVPIIKFVSLAACIAVFVAVGMFFFNNDFISPQISPTKQDETTTNAEEIAATIEKSETETYSGLESVAAPKWNDMITPQKYGEMQIGTVTYSSQVYEIAQENVFEFVTQTQLTGYDIYEDKNYKIDAEAYSIKNINKECALAVKFSGEDKFYVYVNVWYIPETLEEFIVSLNLKENLSFGNAYYDYVEGNRDIYLKFSDFDDRLVWDMILDDTKVESVDYNGLYEKLLDISVEIELLGENNKMLCVTSDGYVITNLLNTQKSFFIGEEKAKVFANYIFENVEYKENITVFENSDGSVAGKADSTPAVEETVSQHFSGN